MVNLFLEALPAVYLCCDALIAAEDVASAMRFQNESVAGSIWRGDASCVGSWARRSISTITMSVRL